MRAPLAVFSLLILLNYALSPGHAVTREDLVRYLFPGDGSARPDFLLSVWLSRGRAILAWGFVNLAVAGAGPRTARWLAAPPAPIRAWLAGILPVSLVLLGFGLCGLLNPPVIAAALLLLAGPAIARARGIRRVLPGRDLVLAVVPCLLALPAALAPEIAFDPLRYHLALPALWLREHKIFAVERFLFSGFPGTMETLYAAALAFGTTVSARLLAWQCLVLMTAQLHGYLAPRLGRTNAVLLCAGFAATPFLSVQSAFAGVDMMLGCLTLGAFLLILESPGRKAMAAAGYLFGTALGVKYLGAYAVAAAGLALLTPTAKRDGRAAIRRFALVLLPIAVLAPSAWWVKNWLLTGNPAYPYIFGHLHVTDETMRLHLLYADNWRRAHPWVYSWASLVPVSLSHGIYDAIGEALSPFLFMLPALIASAAKPLGTTERRLVALCAVLYGAWCVAGGGIYRFLVPFFPAAALATGLLIARTPALPARAVAAFLGISLLFQIPVLTAAHRRQSDPGRLTLGHETEMMYVIRTIPPRGHFVPALSRACDCSGGGRRSRPNASGASFAGDAGAGGRLYVLGDPMAFYSPCRTLTEFEFAPPLLMTLAEESPTTDRMRVRLRQRNLTALLYRPDGMISMGRMSGARLTGAALVRYAEFWRDWMRLEWIEENSEEKYFLQCFSMRRAPGKFTPPASELWYLLPGTESLTQEIDVTLDAGQAGKAREMARELTTREPGFAPGWYRLYNAARLAGDSAGARRAAGEIRRLGFGRLLESNTNSPNPERAP